MREKFINDVALNGLISAIQTSHKIKFPTDLETQEQKLLAEIHEFEATTNLEDKVEEAVDIIISAIGFIDRAGKKANTEIYSKFLIDLERDYPDNFQHKENCDD